MTEKWNGKIAVITGASSGIGSSIFKSFACAGIITIGLARRVEKIEDLIKDLENVKAFAFKCDVSDSESVNKAFNEIEEKFGIIHILVNNAGIAKAVNVFDESEESFQKMNEILDTNVRVLTQCSRRAFQLMKKANDYGMIININSIVGHLLPYTGYSTSMYGASKYAITALSETMRQEIIIQNNDKIRVSSISPGYVSTEFILSAGFVSDLSQISEDLPRLSSDNVSQAVMYLLSTPYNVNITELTIKPVGEKM